MKMRKALYLIWLCLFSAVCTLTACIQSPAEEGNEPSAPVQLAAPQNLRRSGDKLIWDEVENAAEYLAEFEGEQTELAANYFYIPDEYGDETCLRVKAIGDGSGYTDSEWSRFVEHGYDESGLEYTLLEDGSGYELYRGKADYAEYDTLVGELVLPDLYNDLPVKKIADKTFIYIITSSNGTSSWPDPHTEKQCNIVTTGIKLPAYLETIGRWAFSCMIKVEEIVIPDTVTEIGKNAFWGCTSLKRVKLPSGLKTIPEYCFNDCSLESVEFPDGLEEIGAGAFFCELYEGAKVERTDMSFTEVVIPASVKSIGATAFEGCLKLENITILGDLEQLERAFGGETAWYESQPDGFVTLSDASGKILYAYKGDIEDGTVLELPADIVKIAGSAFANKRGLAGITVPDGIRLIGSAILGLCTSLTRAVLPSDLTEIPAQTFAGDSSLTDVEIPQGVTEIGRAAFNACKSLAEIELPSGLKTIGEMAFGNCSSLDEISIPSSVTSIGYRAFYNCSSLTGVVIPASVTYIGYWAFYGCGKLASVMFENTVGWSVSTDEDGDVNAAFISAAELEDDETAAEYLTSSSYYTRYYWRRTD